MKILVVLFLVVSLARAERDRPTQPSLRFSFEQAMTKIKEIPPPPEDKGLAGVVSACIDGVEQDHDKCVHALIEWPQYLQNLYLRGYAIRQADSEARHAFQEAEKHKVPIERIVNAQQPIQFGKV